jgi:hypothetical protein
MHKTTVLFSVSAIALAFSSLATADFTNGPNPYDPGFGFDTPDQAGWGWSRGDAGTIYAEWEDFTGQSSGMAPDIGISGTSSANLTWNPGTFAASTGNLYNFGAVQIFGITIDGNDGPAAGPITVGLQVEAWGNNVGYDNTGNAIPGSILLNGISPDTRTVAYFDPDFNSSFGPVELFQNLFTWTIDAPADDYLFQMAGGPHLSFSQVAVDIGTPAAVPLPAAAWLFGSAALGLIGIGRRRRAA